MYKHTSTDKQAARQKVLEKVYLSIEQRMNIDSVNAYVIEATKYGKAYGIETLVKEWIMEGRTVFTSPESTKIWVESLP
jgi:hypothetical protein